MFWELPNISGQHVPRIGVCWGLQLDLLGSTAGSVGVHGSVGAYSAEVLFGSSVKNSFTLCLEAHCVRVSGAFTLCVCVSGALGFWVASIMPKPARERKRERERERERER